MEYYGARVHNIRSKLNVYVSTFVVVVFTYSTDNDNDESSGAREAGPVSSATSQQYRVDHYEMRRARRLDTIESEQV